jgi:hypothetical protein
MTPFFKAPRAMLATIASICIAIAVAPSSAALAQESRSFSVDCANPVPAHTPITIPFGVDGDWTVLDKSGSPHGATARNGELVFTLPDALPAGDHQFTAQKTIPPKVAPVRMDHNKDKGTVNVSINGSPLTTFHYKTDARFPYLWPLNLGDTPMTRAWPMGEKEKTDDHKHHKSFWTSFGLVNDVDFWENHRNSGVQAVKSVAAGSGDAYGWIVADIVWQSHKGEAIMHEQREYRFYTGPADARLIDLRTRWSAPYGPVHFGDTKEGGIVALRVRDAMMVDEGGTITMSEERTGDVWGQASPWCDYSGALEDGEVRGIAVFDHPTNLRYPARWHVRGYGLFAANYFGLKAFTKSDDAGDYRMKKGEALAFNLRLYLHEGDADVANVADHHAAYAASPVVRWD